MRVGVVIHLLNNNQDSRMNKVYPYTWRGLTALVIPIIRIIGVTCLRGFVSKELILLQALNIRRVIILIIVLYVGVLLTIVYRFGIVYSLCKGSQQNIIILLDTRLITWIRLFLVGGSIVGGDVISSWMRVDGYVPTSWNANLYIKVIFMVGVLLWDVKLKQQYKSSTNSFMYLSEVTMWGVPKTINSINLTRLYWDKGWLEVLGPQWVNQQINKTRMRFYLLSTQRYKIYFWIRLIGLRVMIII